MLDLLIIIVAAVGLIFVILPSIARSRVRSSRMSCTGHLMQVGLSFRQWHLDNGNNYPMQVAAKDGGAMEEAQLGSAYAIFLVMSNELSTPTVLLCPNENNRKRVAAHNFSPTVPPGSPRGIVPFTATNNISYFVGLDADQAKPDSLITGDDNFAVANVQPAKGLLLLDTNRPVAWVKGRHPYGGNVALADGSVQSYSAPGFRAALVKAGIATNRMAMP